jgi:hypothetical protein
MHLRNDLCFDILFEDKLREKIVERNEHYKKTGRNALFIMISQEIISLVSDLSISRINEKEKSYCVRFLGSIYDKPCKPIVGNFSELGVAKKLTAKIISKFSSIEGKNGDISILESWDGSGKLNFKDIYDYRENSALLKIKNGG